MPFIPPPPPDLPEVSSHGTREVKRTPANNTVVQIKDTDVNFQSSLFYNFNDNNNNEQNPNKPTSAQPLSSDEVVSKLAGNSNNDLIEYNEKIWERPWSLSELKQGSKNWSLSSDAGMLRYLQEFSQRITCNTRDVSNQLSGLSLELLISSGRISNVANSFLMLSMKQFVENRVFDDDETLAGQENESSTPKALESSAQAASGSEISKNDNDLFVRANRALKLGLDILNDDFERVELSIEPSPDSNSAGEGSSCADIPQIEPEWEAKDLYSHRPFPALIGSDNFNQTDHLGLQENESISSEVSDTNDEVCDTAEQSEQDPARTAALETMDIVRRNSDGSLFNESDGETSPNKKSQKNKVSTDREPTDTDVNAIRSNITKPSESFNPEDNLFDSSGDSEDLFSEERNKEKVVIDGNFKPQSSDMNSDAPASKKKSNVKQLAGEVSTLGTGVIFNNDSSSDDEKSLFEHTLQDSSTRSISKVIEASNNNSMFENGNSSEEENLFSAIPPHKNKQKTKFQDDKVQKSPDSEISQNALVEGEKQKSESSDGELFSEIVNPNTSNKSRSKLKDSSSKNNPKKKLPGAVPLFLGLGESDLFSKGILKKKLESSTNEISKNLSAENIHDTSNTKSNGILLDRDNSSSDEELFRMPSQQIRSKEKKIDSAKDSSVENKLSSLFSKAKISDNISSDNESDSIFSGVSSKTKSKYDKSLEDQVTSKPNNELGNFNNVVKINAITGTTGNEFHNEPEEELYASKGENNSEQISNEIHAEVPSSQAFSSNKNKKTNNVKFIPKMFDNFSDSDSEEELFSSSSKVSRNYSKDTASAGTLSKHNSIIKNITSDYSNTVERSIVKKEFISSNSNEKKTEELFSPIYSDQTKNITAQDEKTSNIAVLGSDLQLDIPNHNSKEKLTSVTKSLQRNDGKIPDARERPNAHSKNSVKDSLINQAENSGNNQIVTLDSTFTNNPVKSADFKDQLNQTLFKQLIPKQVDSTNMTQPSKESGSLLTNNETLNSQAQDASSPNFNKIRPKNPNRRPQTRAARVQIANESTPKASFDLFFNDANFDSNQNMEDLFQKMDERTMDHIIESNGKEEFMPTSQNRTLAEDPMFENNAAIVAHARKAESIIPANDPNFTLAIPDDLFASVHLPPASSKRTKPQIVSAIQPSTIDLNPPSNAIAPTIIHNNENADTIKKVNSKISKRTDDDIFGTDDLFDAAVPSKLQSEKTKKKKVKDAPSKKQKKNKEFNPSIIDDLFN